MTDSIELTAAYKRLALAELAYYDAGYDDEAEYAEMKAAESALRALLAPEPRREDHDGLIANLSVLRDDTRNTFGAGSWRAIALDRAIAALEGSRG